MEELPRWEAGTPAVLCAHGPHAIPVSTVIRASGKRVLFALARSRETLERIRQNPAVALCVMAEGLAFTAHGHAAVVEEELEEAPRVAALELRVTSLQDHLTGAPTEMLDGAHWRFSTDEAREADAAVRAGLARLAST